MLSFRSILGHIHNNSYKIKLFGLINIINTNITDGDVHLIVKRDSIDS